MFGYFTHTQEYHSRYHLDTLREERFVTSRVIGIPVWQSERKAEDRYSDTYSRITGLQPDSAHWKVMPPDYIRSHRRGSYRCHGFGMEIHERMYLLEILYERFKAGMPRETAAEIIRRIDVLLPARPQNRQELNIEGINGVRKKLGIETW
jgi:hypothetical protein